MGMVGLHVIEYLLRVPWVWGFPRGFQWGFLWVCDGYGDWDAIPTAALLDCDRSDVLLTHHLPISKPQPGSESDDRWQWRDTTIWTFPGCQVGRSVGRSSVLNVHIDLLMLHGHWWTAVTKKTVLPVDGATDWHAASVQCAYRVVHE